jgi:CRP/FNR family cyclic AMP-dependent transcriptional regulator
MAPSADSPSAEDRPDVAESLAILRATSIFRQFAADDIAALAARAASMRHVRAGPGADIVREDDPAPDLLILRSGEASVLKRSGRGGQHEVNRLRAGDTIGELAMLDPAPRSATVRAISAVDLLSIPIAEIAALAVERPSFAVGLLGAARAVVDRLRESTNTAVESLERALEEERTRIAMGKFTFLLIVAYSLYTWLLGTASQVKQALGRSELVTVPVILVTVSIIVWFMKSSGYPAAFFGVTLRRAGRDVLEACALTLPLMALVVVLKWWLVNHLPSMQGEPLFQLLAPVGQGTSKSPFNPWLALAYVVFVPFQELVYRGSLQGALEHFLTGPWRRWLAILGSNIIFSAGHLYISPGLSANAFIAGLFWGWLYSRQRGLAGVSASHILLGFWAFEVVDLGVLE